MAQFYDSDEEVDGRDLFEGFGGVEDDPDDWAEDDGLAGHIDDEEPRGRNWLALIAGGFLVWVVVSYAALNALLSWHDTKHSASQSALTPTPATAGSPTVNVAPPPPPTSTAPVGPTTAATPSTSAPAAPAPGDLPVGWTVVASDQQTDCAAHSFGKVKTYFEGSPCVLLTRWLATTTVSGREAVVSWVIVRTADSATADQFLAIVSADGTGDVRDLLSDGAHVAGLPSKMPEGAFSSNYFGSTVHIAEASWAAGDSTGDDKTLQSLADQGSVLS